VDHPEAGVAVRARGQGLLAVVVVGVAVLLGIAAGRLGPAVPSDATSGSAPSGAWFCPHGGGKEWKATLTLADPGSAPSSVRVTSITPDGPAPSKTVEVPAGSEVSLSVPAADRASSTYVEWFGGWVAAGWVTQGGAGEVGAGAEPCAPQPARTWYLPDNTTEQGQQAYAVVMNPFGADAVFNVTLFTADRDPIRSSRWTDLSLKPHHSVALPLGSSQAGALGEAALTAQIDVTSGRVAAASLGIASSGGIRSTIGITHTSAQVFLPVAAGAGQSQIEVAVPGRAPVTYGATLLSKEPQRPIVGLISSRLTPGAAEVHPVITSGPSVVDVSTQGGGRLVAALRAVGVGNDTAATAGVDAAASSWVVLPAVAGEPSVPGMVLANPGDQAVVVTLHLLVAASDTAVDDITVTVPPATAMGVSADFLASNRDAAVWVHTDGAGIIALGASTSLGVQGRSVYGLSAGVPVPGTTVVPSASPSPSAQPAATGSAASPSA
jgi:hypothetical protein